MSSYILDTIRTHHEDIERTLRIASDALIQGEHAQLLKHSKAANKYQVFDPYGRFERLNKEESQPLSKSARLFQVSETDFATSVQALPSASTTASLINGSGRAGTGTGTTDMKVALHKTESVIHSMQEAELIARNLIQVAADISRSLHTLYTDQKSAQAQDLFKELLVMGGGPPDSKNQEANLEKAVSSFYFRLKDLKKQFVGKDVRLDLFDQNSGVDQISPLDTNLVKLVSMKKPVFSGEEAYGRYLDLYSQLDIYNNIKGICGTPRDYLTFINSFHDFSNIPIAIKQKSYYGKYLDSLLTYLLDFCDRVLPLLFVRQLLKNEKDIVQKFGFLPSKESLSAKNLHQYGSPQELLDHTSPDILKAELLKRGLKCGGTPLQRAERLYDNFRKSEGQQYDNHTSSSHSTWLVKEAWIHFLAIEILSDHIKSTIQNIEKKQSLTYAELEAERAALNSASLDDNTNNNFNHNSDSEEEKPIYNPKDVPLGWDGKPIPYWLYKLHGLNHEFKCEICGNEAYRGPRAFERHFTTVKHNHGLRCLGIHYSKDFYMVAKIDEALDLHKKLQENLAVREFNPLEDEECEDAQGNVFNRKTYADLARQGLV